MVERGTAERVVLHEDIGKIINSIAFIIAKANAKGVEPTQYDILKSLFLADKAHLNNWGRLITFDNYLAMKHGPVPSAAYDFLKQNEWRMKKSGVDTLPWSRKAGDKGKLQFFDATIENFEDVLSQSEMDALDAALATVLGLGFSQVRRLTHEDAAYIEAWDDESDRDSFPMSLALFYETPDFEAARTLSEYSPYR